MVSVDLRLGDCRDLLPTVAAQSVDAVITDPPYPEISRSYGRMTEAEWWDMMMVVCAETRRILKPTGSAVFILQPNSRKVGSMRGWLFEFQAWVCREWNMVQDVWWWNHTVLPSVHASRFGLMRGSVKAMIWAGAENCYRCQNLVLLQFDKQNAEYRASLNSGRGRMKNKTDSGWTVDTTAVWNTTLKRGGSTPYNIVRLANSSEKEHCAGTPLALADWWTRYIVPPAGTVCDPFMGSGTMGIAAVRRGHSFIGFEKMDAPGYYPTARERIAKEQEQLTLETA